MANNIMHINTLPPNFYDLTKDLLAKLNLDIELNSKKIAQSILKLSDYYIESPGQATPWDKNWAKVAYLAYFNPLNTIRSQKVIERCFEIGFLDLLLSSEITEFGSGIGAFSSALFHSHYENILSKKEQFQLKINFIERSNNAIQLHKEFLKSPEKFKNFNFSKKTTEKPTEKPTFTWSKAKQQPNHQQSPNKTDKPDISSKSAVFVYSLVEIKNINNLKAYDNILIIEPSTQEVSQKLISLRNQMTQEGYYCWAPCTHNLKCPITKIEKDNNNNKNSKNPLWCHDRSSWNQPNWFQKIEQHLPIKNRTLSFSYLAISRHKPPLNLIKNKRVISDKLNEKGRDRWLLCQSGKAEYVQFLKRNNDSPNWQRGEMISSE